MAKGRIARLVKDKGFGFIAEEDSKTEFFFHFSALQNCKFEELYEGQTVVFDKGTGTKGPRAEGVFVG